jgi:hypothetical protein
MNMLFKPTLENKNGMFMLLTSLVIRQFFVRSKLISHIISKMKAMFREDAKGSRRRSYMLCKEGMPALSNFSFVYIIYMSLMKRFTSVCKSIMPALRNSISAYNSCVTASGYASYIYANIAPLNGNTSLVCKSSIPLCGKGALACKRRAPLWRYGSLA